MTIPQMIRDRHQRWADRPCMMVKREGAYQTVTWSEFYARVQRLARALVHRGVAVGDRVAILSPTRYEWAVADSAIQTVGGITVPLYPSLTRGETSQLIERSGAKILFASDAEQVEKCLPLLGQSGGPDLMAVFDPEAAAGVEDPRVLTLDALEAEGAPEHLADLGSLLERGAEDDLATIIFTSGTTGDPKGVALTHRNILANVEASLKHFDIGTSDTCLAHLPLAHILERMAGLYLMLYSGATIAYAENIQTVAQNIAEVHPTIAVSVPRIFEKIFAGIQAKGAESPQPLRAITFWALGVGRRAGELKTAGKPLPAGLRCQFALADRLAFSKVRHKMGGRLRFFISGGAPLAPELAMFFNAIGVQIYEGYGLTETSPVIAVNSPGRNKVGTVGTPLDNLEVRIADDGEILVRGPSVFSGYYQNEAATKEAFTEDGFFMTGDIGEIDADGFLRITDRKKDLIVTAGGKNVAPQKVENVLKLSKYVADVMLYGDKRKFVSALIVPEPEWLERYAGWKHISYQSRADLVRDPAVIDYYTRLIEEIQEKAELASYERVKKFVLLDGEFSTSEGEVTPTMKIRRRQITEHYKDQLEALYRED